MIVFIALLGYQALGQSSQPMSSSSQPVQITGYLRYPDGSPANEVVVRLERLSGGYVTEVRTDRLGKFRFTELAPQQYHIIVHHPGYREIEREVNLVMVPSENLQLSFIPQPSDRENKPSAVAKRVLDVKVPALARKEFQLAESILASQKGEQAGIAVIHLQKALAIYPNFLEAQLKLGALYLDMQQWDKAEQTLKRAIEMNNQTVNAYLALGEVYFRQKKYTEAEKTFKEGLSVEKYSWLGHFALGRVYYVEGDMSRAGRQIALCMQLNDSFADARFVAANIYLRVNNPLGAREQFEEYLRLAPKGEFSAPAREAIRRLKK
jgi:lipopolysaccharide biosynthesis regulator YciM